MDFGMSATAYTMSMARRDFDLGYLQSWRIERAPMTNGWMVKLGKGSAEGYLVDVRTKKPRVFKGSHTALNAVESVGFEVVSIVPGKPEM